MPYRISANVPDDYHEAIRRSFATWDAEEHPAGQHFVETPLGEDEKILVDWGPMDGPSPEGPKLAATALAYGEYSYAMEYAVIRFDSEEQWHVYGEISCSVEKPPNYPGFDVEAVATHEVGHAIGIGHYEESLLTMHGVGDTGIYQGTKHRTLATGDKMAIEERYDEEGSPDCSDPLTPGCGILPFQTG